MEAFQWSQSLVSTLAETAEFLQACAFRVHMGIFTTLSAKATEHFRRHSLGFCLGISLHYVMKLLLLGGGRTQKFCNSFAYSIMKTSVRRGKKLSVWKMETFRWVLKVIFGHCLEGKRLLSLPCMKLSKMVWWERLFLCPFPCLPMFMFLTGKISLSFTAAS